MKQQTITNYRVNIGNNAVSVSPFSDISVDVVKSLVEKFKEAPNYSIILTKETQVYNIPEESDKKAEPTKPEPGKAPKEDVNPNDKKAEKKVEKKEDLSKKN